MAAIEAVCFPLMFVTVCLDCYEHGDCCAVWLHHHSVQMAMSGLLRNVHLVIMRRNDTQDI